MLDPTVLTSLREALAIRGRVAVRVALDSGPCWVSALKVEARRGAARVRVEIAGASATVAAERVLEVST